MVWGPERAGRSPRPACTPASIPRTPAASARASTAATACPSSSLYLAARVLYVTTLWPAEKNLGELIALSAALLVASQFWYIDEGRDPWSPPPTSRSSS